MFFAYAHLSTPIFDAHKPYAAFPSVGRFTAYWQDPGQGESMERDVDLEDANLTSKEFHDTTFTVPVPSANLRPFVDIHEAVPVYGGPRPLTGVKEFPDHWSRLYRGRNAQLTGHWGRPLRSDLELPPQFPDNSTFMPRYEPVVPETEWWFGSIPHRGYYNSPPSSAEEPGGLFFAL